MTIKVILKDVNFFDNGYLELKNVDGYNVDNEKGFLIIDYDQGKRIYIRLVEIVYFRII